MATSLLQDPNFLYFLSSAGAGLDPQGVAGALGKANQQLIGMQAAQKRATEQTAAQNAQTQLIQDAIKTFGGQTPAGTAGVTKTEVTPQGAVKLEIDPQGSGGSGSSQTPVQGTSPSQPAAPTGGGDQINALLPFYSDLLRRLLMR